MLPLIATLVFYYQLFQSGTTTTPVEIKDYAITESLVAGLDQNQIDEVTTVIQNESGFDPTKIHYNDCAKDDPNCGCNSVGLVQIRSCNHDVSLQQAENPVFAVNFLIDNIDKCHTWWEATCKLNGEANRGLTGDVTGGQTSP